MGQADLVPHVELGIRGAVPEAAGVGEGPQQGGAGRRPRRALLLPRLAPDRAVLPQVQPELEPQFLVLRLELGGLPEPPRHLAGSPGDGLAAVAQAILLGLAEAVAVPARRKVEAHLDDDGTTANKNDEGEEEA